MASRVHRSPLCNCGQVHQANQIGPIDVTNDHEARLIVVSAFEPFNVAVINCSCMDVQPAEIRKP